MFRTSVVAGVLGMAVAAFSLSTAEAQQGRGGMTGGQTGRMTSPGPQNYAPGQQMLNARTEKTSPGNSFAAPGQQKIRARTTGPGDTKTRAR
jgi:hypothetical protein